MDEMTKDDFKLLWENGATSDELIRMLPSEGGFLFQKLAEVLDMDFNVFQKEARRRSMNSKARKVRNQRAREIHALTTGYGGMFTEELKAKVRAKYGYKCALCGVEGHSHDVHHINYDKMDCSEDNLIPLCKHHHAVTTFGHRAYWTALLKRFV